MPGALELCVDKFGCQGRAAGGWAAPCEFSPWAPSNNIIVVIKVVLRATFTEGLLCGWYWVNI